MSTEVAKRIAAEIEEAWRDQPAVLEVCLKILRFVLAPPKKNHLTLGMLRRSAGIMGSEPSPEFAAALQYLLGETAPVLSLGFEFLDEEGRPVRITSTEAMAARSEKINPLSGEFDENSAMKILTFFFPSDSLGL